MVKSIIKRIIVGLCVALGIMAIKGSLIANVHAEGTIYSWETTNNTNFGSCSSCHGLDYNYSMFTQNALKGKDGYLYLNFAFYSGTNNYEYLPVSADVRVYSGNSTFNCTIYGTSEHNRILNSNVEYTTATYSAVCPVHISDDGNGIKKVSIYVLGASTSGIGISFYSPATFAVSDASAITNAIDQNTQAQEETNETLKDDSVDNDKAESDIDDMNDKVASNGTITQLLTLPIQLYQKILNSLNGSCSSISLGSLLGHNLTLTCINLQNILGSTLYNIIDILCCGLFILAFRKKMVDIFNHMTSLNDRGNELE